MSFSCSAGTHLGSLFTPASLPLVPCQSSAQTPCQTDPRCCHPSPSPPCLSPPRAETTEPCPARPCRGCAAGHVSWLCPAPLEMCRRHLPRAAAARDPGYPPRPLLLLLQREPGRGQRANAPLPLCLQGRDLGFARALGLPSISTATLSSGKARGAGGSNRSRAPQSGSGRGRRVPPAPLAPRNIYLYQVEQLHQEKSQLGPGWERFQLDGAAGMGGSDTRGALPPRGRLARVPALHYMGGVMSFRANQARAVPMGTQRSMTHAPPHPRSPCRAASTSGC